MTRARLLVAAGFACAVAAGTSADSSNASITAIKTTKEARTAYLGHAVIWRDPGPLSPTDLVDGPANAFPFTLVQANPPGGIPCAFKEPGAKLGGASPKFSCEIEGSKKAVKVKYWDPAAGEGSREVFAAVAASRLLAALGFGATPLLPVTIRCLGCPEDPVQGTGARATRVYMGVLSSPAAKPPIVTGDALDEGWSWQDLEKAVDALPAGAERTRQRTQFDALTLLGVLIQHGDRKPEQQVLYCDELSESANSSDGTSAGNGKSNVLVEKPGTPACAKPAVAIYDAGATFGGAGLATKSTTAKMNLDEWRSKKVFKDEPGVCRGNLAVSAAAGEAGEADPLISEQGRAFLLERLHRLTPEHLRAIFTAARVQVLDQPGKQPEIAGVDAWVAAFEAKVREIEDRTCGYVP